MNEQIKYTFYIGSDNQTKRLNVRKITNIVNKYANAYTLTVSRGYWESKAEKTAVVDILTPHFKTADHVARFIANELKTHLKQDCVLVERNQVLTTLI